MNLRRVSVGLCVGIISLMAIVVSPRAAAPSGASFGEYQGVPPKSLPMFATTIGLGGPYATPPTLDNLRPLIAYTSHAGTILGGWMYHSILFYDYFLYTSTSPTQQKCNSWADELFGPNNVGGYLEMTDGLVGDLATQLADPNYHLNIFLTICYARD